MQFLENVQVQAESRKPEVVHAGKNQEENAVGLVEKVSVGTHI